MTINRSIRVGLLTVMASLVVISGCDSVEMKGTPLYTGEYSSPQSPPEERVNLWPLFYYHEPALSVLWPIGESTDDHFAVRPLYSVYKLNEERHAHNVLFPLSHFDFDEKIYWILPFAWGGEKGREHGTLFPLVWWQKNDFFCIFPVFWYAPNDHLALFPLFIRNRKDGGSDNHLLWPIMRWKNTNREKGWRVWPLVGSYTKGDKRRRYLLWPLCHESRNAARKSVSRVAFPLYFSNHRESRGWDLLLPVFWRSRGPEGVHTFVTPIIGYDKSPDHSTWSLVPLVSWFRRKAGRKDLWLLGPLAHFGWGEGRHVNHIAPLYYYSNRSGTFWTLLAGGNFSEDRGFFNVLGPVYNHRWSKGGGWSHSALLSVLSVWNRGDSRGSRFWPLYSHERGKSDGRKEGYVLWPLVNYRFGPKRDKFSIAFLFDYTSRFGSHKRKDGVETRTYSKSLGALMLFSRKSRRRTEISPADGSETVVLDEKRNMFFPLWYNKESQREDSTKRDFNILGWLYDYRRRISPAGDDVPEEDYARHRVLWRLYHGERRKDHTSIDIFPFITYDRKRETGFKKISFAWRIFRYQRDEDGSKKVDLLFLPLWRSSHRRVRLVEEG